MGLIKFFCGYYVGLLVLSPVLLFISICTAVSKK